MRKLWIMLICITGAIALWFSGRAVHDLWGYFRLGPTTPVQVVQWAIKELSPSKFGVEATYTYEIDGKQYEGKNLFNKPFYLNPYAAQSELKKWQTHEWHAWYQSSQPSVSSLQKNFPAKEIIQSILTIGVFIYFYFVRSFANLTKL